ncbi:Membrane dipeptidase (Peptidase family M19) [Rhodobacteraceae bacterium SB2]|jgi:membrane dipeptidase|nr:Membrane dipeptidase (Peptidase family M19) [Rhodobacteraceae bacterium SB2]|tara:strand:- start:1133 stop:2110 length:978 start_codon:yes stop_codon:yes gene_type:complete
MTEILEQAVVWDAHAGLFPSPEMDLNTLEDWRKHDVNYLSINVGFDVMSRDETLATLAAYRRWLLAHSDQFLLAGTLADISEAQCTGRLAVSFDIEGMNALGGDINMIEVYHNLGVRQMLFAYNLNNAAAGGCHDTDIALSSFGVDILAEMNRVGMIVDASHASYRTSMDLIERSETPVVFSHSNPASVWQHQRNITDEQIKACAAKGGVIGLNGLAIFVGDNDTSSEGMLRHLFRLIDIAGPYHVGLGFDYTPDVTVDLSAILRARPDYWPEGQQYDTLNIGHSGPSKIPELVVGMQASGLSLVEIAGILGANFARVAKESWVR